MSAVHSGPCRECTVEKATTRASPLASVTTGTVDGSGGGIRPTGGEGPGGRRGTRGGREHDGAVAGHVHADSADQAPGTGVATEGLGHGRQGMGVVVAPRPTVVGESAGDGQGAVVLDAEGVAGERQRTGETGVEVEVGDLVRGERSEGAGHRRLHGR